MNKILRYSFVAFMAMCMGNAFADDVTDALTWEGLGLDGESSSYNEFADKTITSAAVYAGTASSGQGQYIQLRTKNSNEGIVTTTSGGKLKSVKVTFNSKTTDRSIEIYGKNEAYASAADLYGDAKGTLLGTIAANENTNTVIVDGDYTFVGLKSANGAIYVDKVEITWAGEGGSTGDAGFFSATPLQSLEANWDTPTGETEITSDFATISGGKMYTINQQDGIKNMIKKQGGEYAFQCTNNNTFFKVVLDEELKAGDVIKTRMQTRTDTDLGLFFAATDTRPSETTTAIILATAEEQAWIDAPTYTVATDDGICGQSTFYIFRATSKSTYFNTFEITRGGSTGISTMETVRVNDGATYNLAGQKVDSSYKGVVIKNGKKFVVK